jgi:Fe-S-cluster containining protein
MARTPPRAAEGELLRELSSLYAEADRLFEGSTCAQSSECCRFGITGREPQVTSIELTMVRRALAQRGGSLSQHKRALPLSNDGSRERICPLLDRGSRCAIYQARPLGCRTFFCGRAEHLREPRRAELSALVRKLQDLAARHERDGERPRALTRALP